MASKEATKIAKWMLRLTEATSTVGVATGSYMQEGFQKNHVQNIGTAIEFLANQIDVTANMLAKSAKKGTLSKKDVLLALSQKTLSLGDFHDETQCGAAVVSLGFSLAPLLASTPTGPVGWTLAGASFLADLYAVDVDCGVRASVAKAHHKAVESSADLIELMMEAPDHIRFGIKRLLNQAEAEIKYLYMGR